MFSSSRTTKCLAVCFADGFVIELSNTTRKRTPRVALRVDEPLFPLFWSFAIPLIERHLIAA